MIVVVLDGEQVVQGFEIGIAGNMTDKWAVFGGYTFLHSEIESSNNPAEVGNELPQHAGAFLQSVDDVSASVEDRSRRGRAVCRRAFSQCAERARSRRTTGPSTRW